MCFIPRSLASARYPAARVAWLAAVSSIAAGCREVMPEATGVRIQATFPGESVRQLRFRLKVGTWDLLATAPLPAAATADIALASPQTFIAWLDDALDGQEAACSVDGLAGGAVLYSGSGKVVVQRRRLATCPALLVPVDAGADAEPEIPPEGSETPERVETAEPPAPKETVERAPEAVDPRPDAPDAGVEQAPEPAPAEDVEPPPDPPPADVVDAPVDPTTAEPATATEPAADAPADRSSDVPVDAPADAPDSPLDLASEPAPEPPPDVPPDGPACPSGTTACQGAFLLCCVPGSSCVVRGSLRMPCCTNCTGCGGQADGCGGTCALGSACTTVDSKGAPTAGTCAKDYNQATVECCPPPRLCTATNPDATVLYNCAGVGRVACTCDENPGAGPCGCNCSYYVSGSCYCP